MIHNSESRMSAFWRLAAAEPFRLFFPWAALAGLLGVALWPLHLLGVTSWYPGQLHARIMTHGFFGGFILGFLGTAMPRMLSAPPLRWIEVAPILGAHMAMVAAYASAHTQAGNALFLCLLLGFVAAMSLRIRHRKDLPPPGFVLVAFSLACAASGAGLAAFRTEDAPNLESLEKLLTYQGFVLFPILGIGPFILPRFFGLNSSHDLPESLAPTGAWLKKALLAATTGALLIGSFILEAKGFYRLAYGTRFAVTLAYMLLEMPLRRGPAGANIFGAAIRISLFGIVAGFLAVACYPQYRVGMLHLTLIGGFAIITFVVASRVLFGHSGNLPLLQGRNRWFLVAISLMLFGMLTRISGDLWPKIMTSHYIYGALLWIAGVAVWGFHTLPKLLITDAEE